MPPTTPPAKPAATETIVRAAAAAAWKARHGDTPMPSLYLLAVRPYFRDTMGAPGKNDLGIYDDAIFIVTTHGMSAWNANTDPSRAGWNSKAGKYMARLAPGIWKFRRLKHHASSPDGYMAYGQGEVPVTVHRLRQDLTIATTETGCFGINLHRGGVNGTSSEGCLTIPREQWPQFDAALFHSLTAASNMAFHLIMIDGPIN